jgi:hypothetical protein
MADTFTTTLRLQQPTVGADAATWGGYLNTDLVLIDNAINGVASINIAGLATYPLTVANGAVDQARNYVYNFTGALSANCTVTLPPSAKFGYAINSTTGGHRVILTTGSGTALNLPTAAWYQFFYCDGTNVFSPSIGFAYANFLNDVTVNGQIAVVGNATVSGTFNGQAIYGTTVYGASSVNCGPGGWYVVPNGDQHIPYLNGNLSSFLNQPVTSSASPVFADVGIGGLGFLKASFINQSVMSTANPTFNNVYLSYLGNYLSAYVNQVVTGGSQPNFFNLYFGYLGDYISNFINQRVRTVDAPSFANVTINGVGSIWGTLLNQGVRSDESPQFYNIGLGYLGNNLAGVLNQDVRNGASPAFGNPYMTIFGDNIGNRLGQDVRSGSSPSFNQVNSNISGNFSTMNGGGTVYHAPNGNGLAIGGWFTGSDIAFKSDVETLTGSLDKITAVRGVSYTHKKIGGQHLGVIGQEVQEHFPEAVEERDGKLYVNYGMLVAPLIEAVKELRAEIVTLKAKLA